MVKERTRPNGDTTDVSGKSTRRFMDARMKRRLFDEHWLANRWTCSVSFIRKLRYNGRGPAVTYIDGLVRYSLPDVRAYERSNRFKSSSERDVRIADRSRDKGPDGGHLDGQASGLIAHL